MDTRSEPPSRVQQNRHFAAALVMIVVLNALLALVYTLRANSVAEFVWVTFFGMCGWAMVAVVLGSVYVFAVQYGRVIHGVVMAFLALATQAHVFATLPSLLGMAGWLYYIVDAVALVVIGYAWSLRRQSRRESAQARLSSFPTRPASSSSRRAA